MADRVRPYLFYDVAVSICSTCYRKVEGKIVFQDGARLHAQAVPDARPRARAHGRRRGLLPAVPRGLHQAAGDAARVQHAGALGLPVRLRAVPRPRAALVPVAHRDHRPLQPAAARSATRSSGPSRQQYRTLEHIERMLDAVVRNEGEPDVVQISGGEPTLHPRVLRHSRPGEGARRSGT